MLRVENINTYYGTSHILHNVSLEVQDGEIVVLLGRNGVGKSTTLKSIMGIAPSKSGKITLNGEEITRLTPDKIARKGISFIPEDRRIIPNLTVFENLKLGMLIRGKNVNQNETLEMVFQYFPKL
jgi:ABC-type branched-subunit amino acid transport system ATPase component